MLRKTSGTYGNHLGLQSRGDTNWSTSEDMRSRGRFADWDGDRWGDIVLGLAVHDCWGMVREKRIEEGRRRGRGGGDGTDWDTGT